MLTMNMNAYIDANDEDEHIYRWLTMNMKTHISMANDEDEHIYWWLTMKMNTYIDANSENECIYWC